MQLELNLRIKAMGLEVLTYVPNIIGYLRIILAASSFIVFQHPVTFTVLYSSSIALDGIDGYCARKLKQCSRFGSWFDVVIDLFTRGYLWCALYKTGYLVMFVEWLTFLATHSRGENWKITDEQFPWIVKRVMDSGFKSPMGYFAVGSLHLLPLWLYGVETSLLTKTLSVPKGVQSTALYVLIIGRVLCGIVEVFYIKEYALHLLHDER